ncbi:adenylate kinase family protein [Promethearchaeum syntrophicum]|uniref:Putative adenylate kinase n=1 Tax=Promethearchaeum syntrophicum TaxID=2594042 RepID=A0A5B9D7R9_9ARCH|nr:adenylate kinase family protein [Candidatus Prometheoarchaeum syntrophicum]QEE14927.1 putative kinase [Candidatus Prometheoarchaeum syntrophicum]
MESKLYLLSGTPGTGKTTVAKKLKDNNFSIISLGDFVIQNNLFCEEDKKRDTKIIDEEKINSFFSKYLSNNKFSIPIIIESHYADIIDLPCEIAIILRCHPQILEKRLQSRNYSPEKIRENIQAELLGDSTSHMLEREDLIEKGSIFEINSSNLTIEETANKIAEIIQKPENFQDLKAGWLSWLSDPTVQMENYLD